MNRWLSLIFCMVATTGMVVGAAPVTAQTQPALPAAVGGQDLEMPHDEISPEQEQAMWEDIQQNIAMLRKAGLLAALQAAPVTYNFPLQMAPGLPDYAGFRVSAFVDHNPTSGQTQILDYNGGNRTYDGHRGTDYALYPFSWNKVNAGEVQVIAAAAGTIVSKSDNDSTDHNPCDGGSGSDYWNVIALRHADDRITIYGHMRYNSLTSKGIGQTVTDGEYLGTAASSGNSSGPHLHFEVHNSSFASTDWIDPYAGPNSQLGSLWASQRPYYDSAINRLTTHASPPSTPSSCQPSITNLQDSFTTPLNIYFYTHYRDFRGTLPTQLKLYRPDGSVFQQATYTPGNTFNGSWYYGWVANFSNNEPAGTWRFKATYNGQSYQTFFNVNAPTTLAVNSPNGGETWAVTLPHTMTWTDNFGGDVNIALYHNGAYTSSIANNTPSDGDYQWTPPIALTPTSGYKIRVTSVINPAIYDESNASFALATAALIAQDDFALTPIDTPITLSVLGNDFDPHGGVMTITAVGTPSNGGAVNIVGSTLVYTPASGFLGNDVFTYTVNTTTQSANATVTVLVAPQVFKIYLPLIQR